MSKSRLTLSISSRICACTVTSSAVVGSSAISTRGCARAPWRSSRAGACRPRTGAGSPSRAGGRSGCRRRRAPRPRARTPASLETSTCARTASAIWLPTRYIGCRHANGSWKIIATSLPRTSRNSAGEALSRSFPCSRISPVIFERFGVQQPEDREVGDALARAGLAHDAERLAAPQREREARDGVARCRPAVGNSTARSRTSRRSSPLIRSARAGRGRRRRCRPRGS